MCFSEKDVNRDRDGALSMCMYSYELRGRACEMGRGSKGLVGHIILHFNARFSLTVDHNFFLLCCSHQAEVRESKPMLNMNEPAKMVET